MTDEHRWWQRGIVYQVYPRSFQDSGGDGVGDLEGIRARLGHLEWLGVDAVWLSPIFPSPMVDFGYDVADYTGIDPLFGNMAAFDRLLTDAHARGLRLILDFVPNHTSDQHPWFKASRSSRIDPKRDWYMWADPAPGGGPPNNWVSEFGGSAWTMDERTGQYYYHAFTPEQPDLNWRNPAVRAAMLDVLRFWLDRGVDGFRVDVMWHLVKDPELRDNPPNPDYDPATMPEYLSLLPIHSADLAEVHELVAQMRTVLDEYDERLLIGELYLPIDRLVRFYGPSADEAHLPFNMHLINAPWEARALEALIDRYEGALPEGAWPNWVLGNHDNPRIASRVGEAQAGVAAMLLLTLRGTPTMYYGDEIGMVDVPVPTALRVDVREEREPDRGFGRDPCRTPMQWDRSPNAGFTSGTPWLPLAADADVRNVEAARADAGSLLTLYRGLIEIRRREPALSVGSYASVPATGDVLAYLREGGGRRFAVALNLGGGTAEVELGEGRLVVSTRDDRSEEQVAGRVELRGNEGLLVELR